MNENVFLPNTLRGILYCLIIPLFVLSGCASDSESAEMAPEWQESTERTAIEAVLMRQQDAWNAGNIEAFMDDYVKTDSLRFTSDGIVRYGWETSLQRYYDSYPNRDAMGSLIFDDLKVDVLSAEWAMTFGSWHLTRGGEYDDIGGKYTLLMHKGDAGWKVLYDHTSTLD